MSGGLNRSSSAASKNVLPPQELLDDLCSRFVLNVPKEDQQSFERILFLVEYAHWFYEDNSVEKNPSLKLILGVLFYEHELQTVFNNCDVLKPYVAHIDDIFKDFTSYKVRVPVTGAIILDETYERCLLVKGWKGTSWSFPRGKKSKDEEDHKCAIREVGGQTYGLLRSSVLEETGFDVSNLLSKEDHIEMIFGQQRVRLYIIAGVNDETYFAPQTKKEISEIAWQRLDELPANNDVISRGTTGLKLYMAWISVHPPIAPRSDKPCKGISVWRAKHGSSGGSSTAVESQLSRAVADVRPPEAVQVRSFVNFRFDTGPILQAIDLAFSA
ncbi:decapping 2 [Striga asiatica]|uniref:Decapping 2 n=1 Tax=Striga asiatica TaxID=4170 RepID=A0A5A7NY40_STRAF|nr:decapping 2 [Striga asiatica]